MGIVVDMRRLADHADAYMLVSGDADYVEATEYLQSKKGLRGEVVSVDFAPPTGPAWRL